MTPETYDAPPEPRRHRVLVRTRPLAVTVTAMACALLAACGSQVPPSQVIGANYGATAGGSSAPNSALGGGNVVVNGGGSAVGAKPGKSGSNGGGALRSGGGSSGGGSGAGASGGGGGAVNVGSGGATTVASCAGFKNQTGVTDSTITLANASDLSGPVPGLFKTTQQATQAFVSYFNSTSSICGRKLKLVNLDSQTSTTGDQQAATSACSQAFAMVGSMSAFDSGGASVVTQCQIPDIRAASTETARYKSPVVYGVYSLAVPWVPLAGPNYFKSTFPGVQNNAAFLYLNAGASSLNASSFIKGEEIGGYHFVYTQGIDVTTFNYAPYVQQMMSKGVKYVQWIGSYQNAVRLKQAMDAQHFNPVFVMDPIAYDPGFIKSGSAAVNGTYIHLASSMLENAGSIPEMQLYEHWLAAVAPGAAPSFFGMYAWAAGELFVQKALALGGQLTRSSLVSAVSKVDNYTGNGLFPGQHIGAKKTAGCEIIIQLENGKWVQRSSGQYVCAPVVNTGIGS